jgi:hypothetical protein
MGQCNAALAAADASHADAPHSTWSQTYQVSGQVTAVALWYEVQGNLSQSLVLPASDA